jgi:hypothetical protein
MSLIKVLNLNPYNIKSGIVTLLNETTVITLSQPLYNGTDYVVSITPKIQVTKVPYVKDVTNTTFTLCGEIGATYYWMTVSISSNMA